MERFYQAECDPGQMSPLTLAFVGDCVFELFVRERLVCLANRPARDLHRLAVDQVCCRAQAEASRRLVPLFTDEEAEVFRRGRNTHVTHIPKNSTSADYHAATALETLFGYLYLKGELSRLRRFFLLMCEEGGCLLAGGTEEKEKSPGD